MFCPAEAGGGKHRFQAEHQSCSKDGCQGSHPKGGQSSLSFLLISLSHPATLLFFFSFLHPIPKASTRVSSFVTLLSLRSSHSFCRRKGEEEVGTNILRSLCPQFGGRICFLQSTAGHLRKPTAVVGQRWFLEFFFFFRVEGSNDLESGAL